MLKTYSLPIPARRTWNAWFSFDSLKVNKRKKLVRRASDSHSEKIKNYEVCMRFVGRTHGEAWRTRVTVFAWFALKTEEGSV